MSYILYFILCLFFVLLTIWFYKKWKISYLKKWHIDKLNETGLVVQFRLYVLIFMLSILAFYCFVKIF